MTKKISGALLALSVMMLALPGMAAAQLSIDAKDFTEPVESTLGTAVPIVVGFIAAVFVVGFVIRWIQKRANSAK